jgi:hypothetical protein
MLREAMKPGPANIALAESAASAILPEVQLDAVTIGTALGALECIAPKGLKERWTVRRLSDDPPAYAVTLTHLEAGEPDALRVNVPSGDQDRMLQVFSIKELIDPPMPGGLTPETVLSAVDLALRMAGEGSKQPPAAVKFHPDSGLIILEAPPQQIGAIEGLLQRMRNDVERQRDRVERTGRQHLDDEMALRVASARVQSCEARLSFLKESLDRVTKLRDGGNVSEDEYRAGQMQLVNAQSDFGIAAAEAQSAKARLEAGSGLSGGGEADALRAQVSQLQQQVAALQAKIKAMEAKKK